MSDSLVDSHGFPRTDIDVYQVRHARHEIHCLQNDLKDLIKEIEAGLADYHAEGMKFPSSKNPPGIISNCPVTGGSGVVAAATTVRSPFVVVNLVSANSPAEEAVSDTCVEYKMGHIKTTFAFRVFKCAMKLWNLVVSMGKISLIYDKLENSFVIRKIVL